MKTQLCVTIRYLQPLSHGRGAGGEPEWPPTPLRLFQALVAAAAARWNERMVLAYAVPALRWLEGRPFPIIVAAPAQISEVKCQFYVPDNTGDLLVPAFTRGDLQRGVNRSEKIILPVHLNGEAVHYIYELTDGECPHIETLTAAARSITHLGWGIDMAVGNAAIMDEKEVSALKGEVWRPVPDSSGTPLRVPIQGTLDALISKHEAFLNRLSKDGFKPVPPLSTFKVVRYRRATDSASKPWIAFQILRPEADRIASFDTPRRCRDVAAWVRHVTGQVCDGWPFGSTESFVHGHAGPNRQLKGEEADKRFSYLPLPTINHALNRVEAIRRVLITAPPGFQDRIDWIRRRLPGQDLIDLEGEVKGILNILPTNNWVLEQYTTESCCWSTVTPVMWPGHDDNDARKAEKLLRNAFIHAGLAPEVVAGIEELDWRPVGFRAGLDLAQNYRRPENLNGRMYHVRVKFAHPVRGPLAVGAGRYRGFGLFAKAEV
ncbi:type I-U CRISPR-associated protein Cas5/Cas6 [Telmatocola sphagniphila]|uniref:Type I-U CRISPR-associated protein Cas5/Cas6 n=1 Tax=Telmatocola sphagniphila TaxID=1123043 RepID=A0A8E6B2R3_9BACT|nr:type I-U CRISPR-associated protein Csb2 [Telmatocola sphagniphila]QVL30006.1 type I-U CRISPR-associated protein Cas5/Cas6 [Telmatocola sphagniphila]